MGRPPFYPDDGGESSVSQDAHCVIVPRMRQFQILREYDPPLGTSVSALAADNLTKIETGLRIPNTIAAHPSAFKEHLSPQLNPQFRQLYVLTGEAAQILPRVRAVRPYVGVFRPR